MSNENTPANAPTNPPTVQDRAEDMIDNWRRYRYLMFPQQRAIYRQLAERLLKSTHPSLRVLEVGCGSGQGAALLERAVRVGAPAGARAEFTATDSVQGNVDFAAALYPWVRFVAWDVQSAPLSSALHYDVIVAVEVFEHLADPAAALRNMLAMLADEYSTLWVSTPNGAGKPRPPDNPHHVLEYTPAEVAGMVAAAGGRLRAVYDWEHFRPQGKDTAADPLVYEISKPYRSDWNEYTGVFPG